MKKKAIILFYFLFSLLLANAQQTKLRYKIIHADSLSPIPFATLQVTNRLSSAITDQSGIAQLDVSKGDTVFIRALGFYPIKFQVENLNADAVIRVLLIPKTFQINEVTIKGIRNKDELKLAILRMRVEEKQKDLPGLKSYHGPMKKPEASIMSPISMIYESEWAKKQRAKKWAKTLIMPQIK
jgi:hypothetical protein